MLPSTTQMRENINIVQDIVSVLGDAGLSKNQLADTIKQLRGGRKVEGKSAEEAYDALNKYGHDLVADAEAGKLDPRHWKR